MRHLTPADYRVMPWKNGGGTTTEIAIHPFDSGLSGKPFAWRVSMAEVAVDGPFSRFPGYDRHIMSIAGNGMHLDAGPYGPIDLTVPFVPHRFSGDWDVTGKLVSGPVRDFNLMAERARIESSLSVLRCREPATIAAADGAALLYVLQGVCVGNGHSLVLDGTAILEAGETLRLSPLGGEATLALVRARDRS